MTAHASISNHHIICTHQIKYDLFYLTPVPQLVNNTFVAIIPTTKMMALNPRRNEYFPVDSTKLIECNAPEHNTFLCSNTQAI